MLMVVMFITVMMLMLIVGLVFSFFLINFDVLIISLKVFNSGFFSDWEILLNVWNLLFLLMVLIISMSVGIFSISYMAGSSVNNFILLYSSFIFSMVWLILNHNFYWMMLGWDGLGVVSFLLIVFYMNHESINNGLYTLFQNRIGDLFFVLFILGSLDLSMNNSIVLKAGLVVLIVGSCVKSAQFPFNSWLLAAMSAPTPISSLVHSSTLVVAGVYILLQYSYCLLDVLDILKYISILTLLVSSLGLLMEFDMKKLIAYSTLSHVSLMMLMASMKLFKVAYFHLNIHAMFKSTMFMCFGFVMLASFHSQDKRLVSLINLNPLMKMLYYFSCLCLMGLPFLSGFFSKDLIIEKFMDVSSDLFLVLLLLLFLAISAYYSMKLLNLIHMVFPYSMIEKSYLGICSVMIMSIVMIFFVNLYLSLMVSLSLEMISFKMMVYLFVVAFLVLSVLMNLNMKFNVYDKSKNFFEIWVLSVYDLDKFIYWNMSVMMGVLERLSSVKLFLLMNWWVVAFVLVLL